jgi:hypothetical protein
MRKTKEGSESWLRTCEFLVLASETVELRRTKLSFVAFACRFEPHRRPE